MGSSAAESSGTICVKVPLLDGGRRAVHECELRASTLALRRSANGRGGSRCTGKKRMAQCPRVPGPRRRVLNDDQETIEPFNQLTPGSAAPPQLSVSFVERLLLRHQNGRTGLR